LFRQHADHAHGILLPEADPSTGELHHLGNTDPGAYPTVSPCHGEGDRFRQVRIYQASGALYAGRGTPRTILLLPNGRVLNERALAKLRSLDAGHAYVEELLVSFGAPPRRGQAPATWLPRALRAAGVRAMEYPGNHRYLFQLGDRRARRAARIGLPSRPYPKLIDHGLAADGDAGQRIS
jgi:hypothetical protein